MYFYANGSDFSRTHCGSDWTGVIPGEDIGGKELACAG